MMQLVLADINFIKLCLVLQEKLIVMGVNVLIKDIHIAKVKSIHYSKNIPLNDYSRCVSYLDKLSKLDMRSDLDINEKDYRNNGHALKYHANSYEITFYDKRKDLEASMRSEKRAVESDNFLQQDLLSYLENIPKQVEILRMEVRLNIPQKIGSIVKKVAAVKKDLTLMNLFSSELSRLILLDYWSVIEQNLVIYNISQQKEDDLIFAIEKQSGKLSIAKTLKLIGLMRLVNKYGVRGMRAMFGKHLSASSWYSLKAQILSIQANLDEYKEDKNMGNIKRILQEFSPVSIKDYF